MRKEEKISLDQTSFKIIAKTNIDWGNNVGINEELPPDDDNYYPTCTTAVMRVSARSASCSVITLGRG